MSTQGITDTPTTDTPISGEFASNEVVSDSFNLHATILSHIYWSMVIGRLGMANDNFKAPSKIIHPFDKCNESYSKKGRIENFALRSRMKQTSTISRVRILKNGYCQLSIWNKRSVKSTITRNSS